MKEFLRCVPQDDSPMTEIEITEQSDDEKAETLAILQSDTQPVMSLGKQIMGKFGRLEVKTQQPIYFHHICRGHDGGSGQCELIPIDDGTN